jgi:hypothetical protein
VDDELEEEENNEMGNASHLDSTFRWDSDDILR